MDKTVITIATLTVLVFGGIIGAALYNQKNFQARNLCVQHAGLGMHIHPELKIVIDGQPQTIPANIGIDANCMKAIHTHDETGKIHLEYPEAHDFVLGDFFANWGETFSKDQVLDKTVDATHSLTMTVDGQPNTDFEKLVLKDGQQIVITYAAK